MPSKSNPAREGSGPKEARQRILNAASHVFSEDGFEGARVDRIAQKAGVNKAMLYYHVGAKEALYEAVLMNNFSSLRDAMESARHGTQGAEDQLRRVLEALILTLRKIPDHPRLMVRELADGAAHLPEPVVQQMAGVFGIVRDVIEEGKQAGVFRNIDALQAHLAIVGSTVFSLIAADTLRAKLGQVLGPGKEAEHFVEALSQDIVDLILNGICKRDKQTARG